MKFQKTKQNSNKNKQMKFQIHIYKRSCFVHFYSNEFENLDERDKFLGNCNLTKHP